VYLTVKASVYKNSPAARDIYIDFRADVLERQNVQQKGRKTVCATLQDVGKGEIARGSLRCCYLHATKSLSRAIMRQPVYAEEPPPYSVFAEDLEYQCANVDPCL
jgi:hypothetical protein